MANNKKIQVTTIEMRSKAQVIVLDASFVAKAIKADCAVQMVREHSLLTNEKAKATEDVFCFVRELASALLNEDEKQEPECQTKEGEE